MNILDSVIYNSGKISVEALFVCAYEVDQRSILVAVNLTQEEYFVTGKDPLSYSECGQYLTSAQKRAIKKYSAELDEYNFIWVFEKQLEKVKGGHLWTKDQLINKLENESRRYS